MTDREDVVVRPFRDPRALREQGAQTDGGRFDAAADGLGERQEREDALPPLKVVCAADFASREMQPRPWVVKHMIPDCTVTLWSGDGGVGKTLAAQQLATSTALGRDWIGTLPEPGPVVYVSAEDDEDEWHRRLVDIAAGGGFDVADLIDLHLVPLAGQDAVLGAPEGRSEQIAGTRLWRALVDKIKQIRPRLVVLDNLADIFAGNENSRSQARQFIGMLRGLAIEHKLAVVVISHPSLTGLSSGTGTSGSTAWSNSVRSRLYLDRAKAGDGDEPDPNLRILRVMKANYSPVGTEIRIRWEKGRFMLEGGGPGMFDKASADAKAETKFLDLLNIMSMQERPVSPNPGSTYAPAVFAKHPEAGGFRNRAFALAMERLLSAGRLKVESFGPPSKLRHRLVRSDAAA